jgi:hypothetical protein
VYSEETDRCYLQRPVAGLDLEGSPPSLQERLDLLRTLFLSIEVICVHNKLTQENQDQTSKRI